MGLFWKRKSGDQFISLKLNEPQPAVAASEQAEPGTTRVEETAPPLPSPEARYASSDSSAAVSGKRSRARAGCDRRRANARFPSKRQQRRL